MTAALLPISPFWQLRDSRLSGPLRPWPTTLKDRTCPIWGGPDPYMRVWGWILWWYWQQWPTMCPLHQCSGGQGNTSWGFYLMCPAGQEISDSKEISRDLFHVRKRRRANIRLRTGIQRPQRGASDRKADPFRRIYTYTRTHVMYTRVYAHTDAFQSPTPTCSIYGISLFLTNLLIHSTVCLLFKQTN